MLIPSKVKLIWELEVGTQKPFQQYQNYAWSQNPGVLRNTTQVRNARQRYKRIHKGTNSFNNLNRIRLESKDAHFLMTVQDLVMVNITPEMLKQKEKI